MIRLPLVSAFHSFLIRFSVAARLAAVGGGVAALTIALTAFSVVRQVESVMVDRVQSHLEVNLRVAHDQLRRWAGDGPISIRDGQLVGPNGRVLDGDVELVDRVRDIAEGTATLFRGDLRVSTNVLLPDGTRAIGTRLARGPVYDTVFRDGRTYRGKADILGVAYLTAYEPLKDADDKVVGILYVGVKTSSYFGLLNDIRISAALWGVTMILFGGGAILLAVRRAFRPFDALRDAMGALAAGKLDTVVPALGRVDEVGRMAEAVEVFKLTAIEFAKTKAAELSDAHRVAQVGTWRENLQTGALTISEETHALLGTDPMQSNFTSDDLFAVIHPDDRGEIAAGLERTRAGDEVFARDVRIIRRDGRFAWIKFEARAEMDASGRPEAIRGVCLDVTEQHAAADQIYWLAHHDALTGLANRVLLDDRLLGAIARSRHEGKLLAVLCIDLDGFKMINDVKGHAAGDAILREVGARLRMNVRETDTVARLGGDEFVVLHEGLAQPEAAHAMAKRLVTSLGEPYDVGQGQTGYVTASIGVAIYPTDGVSPEALLVNADTALYSAKAAGKNGTAFFRPDMASDLRERRELEHDLWRALDQEEFRLVWQPLCQSIEHMPIIGFEVLLRWHHPTLGPVPPDRFIPIAEACNAISAIGAWVLREACLEAASWTQPLMVSVNVSPIQAQQGDAFAELVEQILAETGLDPSRLMLEVTEGVLIREPERVLSALRRLKAIGVRVALDDFGTGYSSLATLRAFPFDKIKIDRAFITSIAENGQDAAIVRAVLGLARGLGLPVIAEGVETSRQLEALRDAGCQEIQGWLAGRPAPIVSFAHLLSDDTTVSAA